MSFACFILCIVLRYCGAALIDPTTRKELPSSWVVTIGSFISETERKGLTTSG